MLLVAFSWGGQDKATGRTLENSDLGTGEPLEGFAPLNFDPSINTPGKEYPSTLCIPGSERAVR